MRRIVAALIVLSLAFTLLQLDYSKVEGGSYEYYISHWQEVNIPNLVTAILADWRAYDTLGEATLLFTAVIGFYLLLGGKKK
ncbi:hydrogen gas-evolving membrane-bound hydrogenase subunit E [Thermococcus barophilus]|uniref:Multisubunit sodium/hydrogen antiporter n=1 Tax=Thermococcus barophilus (strain DSM 11836 / MP) TaxID=391623 RepID=F0LHJ9_THEBM|nr:hydrogen gas-evolving membrane-bound hydrogenase subunit E [Thermococcus barophilus]ADT84326.1 multisubunit sodium/hydrogen antiporter [Thermococcus barophilus MP]